MNEKEIREEFEKAVGEELGFVSALFMSQGETMAKDIIMPTAELKESLDRISLYVFKSLSDQRKEIEKLIGDELLICHSENTPTSRLTSLAMKIKNL